MSSVRRSMAGVLSRRRGTSRTALGLAAIGVILLLVLAVYNKERIGTMFTSGDVVKAEFSKTWPMHPYRTDVKMSGVKVGTLTEVERTERGTAMVSMKVNEDVVRKLGNAPSAKIRPTLVLGGAYYVDLVPGGSGDFDDEAIPTERTELPVKLGDVLSSFTPSAKEGMRTAIKQSDTTLRRGGKKALRNVLRSAPDTLKPAGTVLESLRGTRPSDDLSQLVSGMESTADILTRRDGQLAAIIDDLQRSTAAFSAESQPLAESVSTMPETLRTTRAGLVDVRSTLELLTSTAHSFRPAARELDPFLAELEPVLDRAEPLLNDLRPLLVDARPLVKQLVPTSRKGTAALEHVRGPVLDRINGPIAETVMSPWRGTGPYKGGGATGNKFYEELGYLVEHAAHAYQYYDKNGGFARLAPGVGGSSAGGAGTPMTLEQYLERLGFDRPGPDADAGDDGLPRTPKSGGPR